MEHKTITTSRLTTAYRVHGTPGARTLLLIHGDASSSACYEPLRERLADEFYMVAPDLRCFGGSDALPVDATRGMRDFSDDIHELVEALGWEKFSILGWSLGGGVAMQYAIDHSERLEAVVLQAPLSPYGFGGTYDADGKKLEPLGLASGAGCANAQLVAALQTRYELLPHRAQPLVFGQFLYHLNTAVLLHPSLVFCILFAIGGDKDVTYFCHTVVRY